MSKIKKGIKPISNLSVDEAIACARENYENNPIEMDLEYELLQAKFKAEAKLAKTI